MAAPKTNSSGGNFPIVSAGNQRARCIWVIDIGTQVTEYKGQEKSLRKILFGFEFPDEEEVVFDESKGPQPLMLSRDFTNSLGDKAALPKFLSSWMTKEKYNKVVETMDLNMFAGKAAWLTIVHNPSKDGTKTYANIEAIAPIPAEIPEKKAKDGTIIQQKVAAIPQPPLPKNPIIMFDIEEDCFVGKWDASGKKDRMEVFNMLPEYWRNKIAASPEWQKYLASRGGASGSQQVDQVEDAAPADDEF